MDFIVGNVPYTYNTTLSEVLLNKKYKIPSLRQANVNLKKEIYGQIDIRHLTG